jgi:hypothetical protein
MSKGAELQDEVPARRAFGGVGVVPIGDFTDRTVIVLAAIVAATVGVSP